MTKATVRKLKVASGLSPLMLESFKRNGRVNTALLDHLSDADLSISDGQGGMSVVEQIAHMAGFRKDWLSEISPSHAATLDVELENDMLTLRDPAELRQALSEGDAAVLAAIRDALKDDRDFEGAYESNPAHFLQHALVHDAHHRGQIMMLLRQSGYSPQQMAALEQATWPIWRE